MKETISQNSLRIAVVILSLLLIWHLIVPNSKKIVLEQSDCNKKFDSLLSVNDSLRYEVFIEHKEVERYEMTLDNLKDYDSVTAEKFEKEFSDIE